MKKLLGVMFVVVVILTGCSGDEGSSSTVCRITEGDNETTFTIHESDGDVTSVVTTSSEYIGEWDEEVLEAYLEMFADMEDFDVQQEGDYLISTMTMDFEEFGDDKVTLDEYIEGLEMMGVVCD